MKNTFKLTAKPFSTSLAAVLIRFYLMMAVVIIAMFSGQAWLAVLSLPIFLSALLGLSIERATTTAVDQKMTPLSSNTAKAA